MECIHRYQQHVLQTIDMSEILDAIAVSYTHLDVYKRQVLNGANYRKLGGFITRIYYVIC